MVVFRGGVIVVEVIVRRKSQVVGVVGKKRKVCLAPCLERRKMLPERVREVEITSLVVVLSTVKQVEKVGEKMKDQKRNVVSDGRVSVGVPHNLNPHYLACSLSRYYRVWVDENKRDSKQRHKGWMMSQCDPLSPTNRS